jgi:hypothetical protein
MNQVKRNLQLTVLRDPHWWLPAAALGVSAIGIPNGDWPLPLPKVLGTSRLADSWRLLHPADGSAGLDRRLELPL